MLFALISGSLLPLAFAPFNFYSLAFFIPALLLYYWLQCSPKQAALLGLIFGCGFFGTGISWIYISIHQFGNTSIVLAALLTALVVITMSLHFVLVGYLHRKCFRYKSKATQCLLAFPALWLLLTFLNIKTLGFPWLLLGYSQLTSPLRNLAPIIGVHGISFFILFVSGALVLFATSKQKKIHLLPLSIIIFIVGASLTLGDHLWTKRDGKPIKVSLIQGNIPQKIKWDAAFLSDNINVYKKLTQKNWGSQLVVWPEGALPVVVQDIPGFMQSLNQTAIDHNTTIITGAPYKNKKTQKYYNAIVMTGKNHGHYLKRHLVPFGEYTPFQSIFKPLAKKFHIPLSDLSHGPKKQGLLQFNQTSIAPFICYEIVFPSLVLDAVKGSNILLAISDDSWFGDSIALPQHLQMAQMRSLETGRYLLLATNTGITAFISPLGNILKSAQVNKREVISRNITPMSGTTPLMQWHYIPVFSLCILLILLSFIF